MTTPSNAADQAKPASGLEAFAAVNVTDRIKLRGDYTFTRAVDATTGLELLRRPARNATPDCLWCAGSGVADLLEGNPDDKSRAPAKAFAFRAN